MFSINVLACSFFQKNVSGEPLQYPGYTQAVKLTPAGSSSRETRPMSKKMNTLPSNWQTIDQCFEARPTHLQSISEARPMHQKSKVQARPTHQKTTPIKRDRCIKNQSSRHDICIEYQAPKRVRWPNVGSSNPRDLLRIRFGSWARAGARILIGLLARWISSLAQLGQSTHR